MNGIYEETVSRSAIIHLEEPEGVKVAAVRLSFSLSPGQSANFMVQVLNKDAVEKHYEAVGRDVAIYASQVVPEAYRSMVPMGWPGTDAGETG